VSIVTRLLALRRRSRLDEDLADEISLHIELRRQSLIDSGMDPAAAAGEARRMLGNVTVRREESKEMWGFPSVETVLRDVRYAIRILRRSPMFAAIAILSLGIGIGSAAAVFTLVDAVLLRKLPVANPDELVLLRWFAPATARMPAQSLSGNWNVNDRGQNSTSFSLPTFESLRRDAPAGVRVVGFAGYLSLNVAIDGVPETGEGQSVSGNYFDTLGLAPAAGRLLTEADDRVGAAPVAVLSYAFWQQRFGGSPAAIGRAISLNAVPVTIVGVMPRKFQSTLQVGETPQVAIPLTLRAALERSASYLQADSWWVLMMARLPKGENPSKLQPSLEERFRQSVAEGNAALTTADLPRLEFLPGARGQIEFRDGTRDTLRVMAAITTVVLLVACAIVANLLLARGQARVREMAVRVAIGASRRRVIRQLATEGLLLAALGSVCGLVIANWIAGALSPALSRTAAELDLNAGADWRLVLFTALVATICTALFALVPAVRATDVRLAAGLQEQHRTSTTSRRRGVLSNGLVAIQVALSVLLLASATVLVRSVSNLRAVPTGFDPSQLLIFRVDPSRNGYTLEQSQELFAQAQERLATLPGVRSATLMNIPLISGGGAQTIAALPEAPPLEPGTPAARAFFDSHRTWALNVGDQFFSTMAIPMLQGRAPDARDAFAGPAVAVINRALAMQLFGTTDVLGKRFKTDLRPDAPLNEVIGVSADAKYTSLRRDAPPTAYFSYRQRRLRTATFAVKTAGDPLTVSGAARETFRQLDPNVPLYALRTQEAQIADSVRRENLIARLAAMLGAVTLALCAIGLFGLLAGEVARRTPEIGLRIALGAELGHVRWMVIRQSLLVIAAGLSFGIPAAIGGTRVLGALLFGLSPADPASLAIAAALIVVVGGIAAYLPARRASRVDPVLAIRTE